MPREFERHVSDLTITFSLFAYHQSLHPLRKPFWAACAPEMLFGNYPIVTTSMMGCENKAAMHLRIMGVKTAEDLSR